MHLAHLWQNEEDENEVQFLFKIDGIYSTKTLIDKRHSDALAEDPKANLPEMNYLQ